MAAACCLCSSGIAAQEYPTRPIRIVVPATPGGATDILARTLALRFAQAWSQQVVVDNRAGGGGIVGSEIVARAAPDGYTLLMIFTSHVINPGLYPKIPYDAVKDFAPVSMVASVPNVLVVHPALPVKSAAEYIALAKAQPGKISYASSGSGSSTHLAGVLFGTMAGVELVHVPYRGAAPAQTDLIGGQVSSMFANMQSSMPHVRSGRLRALALTAKKRSPAAPDLPTLDETVLPGYEATAWFALLAPAATPPAVIAKLNREVVRSLQLPEVRERLASQGADAQPGSPQELAAYIKSELVKWSKVVKESGARAD